MTIYRLYSHNGDRAGFWVQHRSWPNMCARIQSIGGQAAGKLPNTPPLHDNIEVLVSGFDVRSGRPVPFGPRLEHPEDQKYTLIAKPWWYHETKAPVAVAAQ
jgi:hypothetical protein